MKKAIIFISQSQHGVFHLDDVGIGAVLVRVAVLGVLEQDAAHVRAGVLEQLVGVVEYDERDLTVAQHAQFVRLLHCLLYTSDAADE